MTLVVIYKSGFEKSINNVTSVSSSVKYVNGTPLYEMRYYRHGEVYPHDLHRLKSFEIYNDKFSWVKTDTGLKCPICDLTTRCRIDKSNPIRYCPYCGNDNL